MSSGRMKKRNISIILPSLNEELTIGKVIDEIPRQVLEEEGYTKALLNKWYHPSDKKVLSTEYSLLGRILFNFLPYSLGLLFRHPIIALRRLWVCLLTLSSVATGYASYTLRNLLVIRRQT